MIHAPLMFAHPDAKKRAISRTINFNALFYAKINGS